MIRTAKVIFCDEEHGIGDVSFPDTPVVDMEFNFSSAALWQEARNAGWRKIGGRHLCPTCVDCHYDRNKEGR